MISNIKCNTKMLVSVNILRDVMLSHEATRFVTNTIFWNSKQAKFRSNHRETLKTRFICNQERLSATIHSCTLCILVCANRFFKVVVQAEHLLNFIRLSSFVDLSNGIKIVSHLYLSKNVLTGTWFHSTIRLQFLNTTIPIIR
jgi:hypothetical protein